MPKKKKIIILSPSIKEMFFLKTIIKIITKLVIQARILLN